MKPQLIEILECPYCCSKFCLVDTEEDQREIRRGALVCASSSRHRFEIKDGIVRFGAGFDSEAVKKEIAYENSTYHGSPRLTDASIIARFPDTLPELWPHTLYFGPDFRALIDRLDLKPGAWVLDIGTGPCWSSRLLAQRGTRVIALDVNEADYYGLKTSDHLFAFYDIYFERILESMTCLPFKDESIDRVTFNASFHHTPNLRQTLLECRRVLKPSGMVAMVNEEFGSLRQRLFRNGPITDEGSHHRIPFSEFEAAAREVGFKVKYHVADHVRQQLMQRLSSAFGGWIADFIEHVPPAIKQLNSALVILNKTNGR